MVHMVKGLAQAGEGEARFDKRYIESRAVICDNEIKPGEERRGIVFFDLKTPATNINSVVIEIKGADKPILLTIDPTSTQTTN